MNHRARVLVRSCSALFAQFIVPVGCDSAADDGGEISSSEPLPVDGLLLVHEIDHRLLVDPSTGKHSAPIPHAFTIAPDLGGLVYRPDTVALAVARFERAADGTPAFTTSATLALPGPTGPNQLAAESPGFNAQGDRVGGAVWWDPASGDHLAGGGAMSPDGRHHLGPDGLYDDWDALMPASGALGGESFTGDGQWLVGADGLLGESFWLTHVPTRTKVLRPDADRPERGFPRPIDPVTSLRVPYGGTDPRGRLVFLPSGRRGLVLPPPCGTPPEQVGPIAPITQWSAVSLANGDGGDPIETPLEALNALPPETNAEGRPYDGFEWSVLGLTPDGRAAIVQHQWYFIDSSSGNLGCPILFYSPATLDIFRLELGGDGTLVPQVHVRDGVIPPCVPPVSLDRPFADQLRRTAGLRFLDEDDWLCGGDEQTSVAFIDGRARLLPQPGATPTLDGQRLLGEAPTAAAAIYGDSRVTTGLCVGPLTGSADACLVPPELPWARLVIGQVGVGLAPRATNGPVVTALSHRSATPGTTVFVRGYGFGAAGALHLGTVTVSEAAITSRRDDMITFVMPPDAPDLGPVAVSNAAGERSAQRHLWLGRSEPWHAAPVVPEGPFELHQGVNRYAFPGAGAFVAGLASLDQIFPGGDLPTVPEGAGPDHVDALVPVPPDARVDYRWITFRSDRGLSFRPLVVHRDLASDAPWQPIGGAVAVHASNRFVTAAGLTFMLQPYGPAAAIIAGGPGTEWQVGGFTAGNDLAAPFRDGADLWRQREGRLERLTGWTELDGATRSPVFTAELTLPFALPVTSFGIHDDLIVAMTQETLNGRTYGALHVSVDRGARFTEAIPASEGLWTTWSAVVTTGRPGLYGTVSTVREDGVRVEGIARITLDGALEVDATLPPSPDPNLTCGGGLIALGSRLLCHDEAGHRLYAVDVGVAEGAAWTEVGGELAGHISAVSVSDDALLVGTDGGAIHEATLDLATWVSRDQVALGPVAMPLSIHALTTLPGGGMVVLALGAGWSNGQIVVRAAGSSTP